MTDIELMIYDQKGSSPKVMPGVQSHNRHMLKAEAEFAKIMIQTGMVAGSQDGRGEHARMKLMAPADVVNRACKLAELAYAEFSRRGWIVDMPSYDEMRKEIAERESLEGGLGFYVERKAEQNGQASPRG